MQTKKLIRKRIIKFVSLCSILNLTNFILFKNVVKATQTLVTIDHYGAVTLGDFTADNGQSKGAIAVKNNFSAPMSNSGENFSVNNFANHNSGLPNLLIGGNLYKSHNPNSRLIANNVYLNEYGDRNNVLEMPTNGGRFSSYIIGRAFQEYRNKVDSLLDKVNRIFDLRSKDNTQKFRAVSEENILLSNVNSVNDLKLGGNTIDLPDMNHKDFLIVRSFDRNISFNNTRFTYKGRQVGENFIQQFAKKILWVFPNAENINLSRENFPGTILAPEASTEITGGIFNGQITSNNLRLSQRAVLNTVIFDWNKFEADNEELVDYIPDEKEVEPVVIQANESDLLSEKTNNQSPQILEEDPEVINQSIPTPKPQEKEVPEIKTMMVPPLIYFNPDKNPPQEPQAKQNEEDKGKVIEEKSLLVPDFFVKEENHGLQVAPNQEIKQIVSQEVPLFMVKPQVRTEGVPQAVPHTEDRGIIPQLVPQLMLKPQATTGGVPEAIPHAEDKEAKPELLPPPLMNRAVVRTGGVPEGIPHIEDKEIIPELVPQLMVKPQVTTGGVPEAVPHAEDKEAKPELLPPPLMNRAVVKTGGVPEGIPHTEDKVIMPELLQPPLNRIPVNGVGHPPVRTPHVNFGAENIILKTLLAPEFSIKDYSYAAVQSPKSSTEIFERINIDKPLLPAKDIFERKVLDTQHRETLNSKQAKISGDENYSDIHNTVAIKSKAEAKEVKGIKEDINDALDNPNTFDNGIFINLILVLLGGVGFVSLNRKKSI